MRLSWLRPRRALKRSEITALICLAVGFAASWWLGGRPDDWWFWLIGLVVGGALYNGAIKGMAMAAIVDSEKNGD